MVPAIMLVRLRKDLEAQLAAQDKRIIELERQLAMFRPVSRRKVVSAGLFIERSAGKQ
jgi:uncharacterized coiled-coil protein SlyX